MPARRLRCDRRTKSTVRCAPALPTGSVGIGRLVPELVPALVDGGGDGIRRHADPRPAGLPKAAGRPRWFRARHRWRPARRAPGLLGVAGAGDDGEVGSGARAPWRPPPRPPRRVHGHDHGQRGIEAQPLQQLGSRRHRRSMTSCPCRRAVSISLGATFDGDPGDRRGGSACRRPACRHGLADDQDLRPSAAVRVDRARLPRLGACRAPERGADRRQRRECRTSRGSRTPGLSAPVGGPAGLRSRPNAG